MRVSLSVGEYALAPYFIPGMEIPIYCIEELCICVKENAFFIDSEFMSGDLVEWLDKKCGLGELARTLDGMIHKQGSLSGFVMAIMEYAGLYDQNTLKGVEDVLKRGAGRNGFEKRKERVDYLVAKKQYAAAIRGYEGLIRRWNELSKSESEYATVKMKAAIIHNQGVAYAGMMQYARAAEKFLEAYELTGETMEQVVYLAAKRMQLSEGEYVSFVSGQPDIYTGTLQLEKRMDALQKDWERQADYQRLVKRRQMRLGADKQKYYDENERLIQALKENYRKSMEI